MTQADIAQKLGVSFQSVSKWENGTLPNVELLSDLARLFGITVDEILAGEEKQKHPILTARRESTFLIQMQ